MKTIKAYGIYAPAIKRNNNKAKLLLYTISKGPRISISQFIGNETQWGFQSWKEAYAVGYRVEALTIEVKK